MRWRKAQESEPGPGSGIEERVAWLEKHAMSTDNVIKAQDDLIVSQGAMINALKEQGDARADRHDKLAMSTDRLIKAQGAMIEALDEQVKAVDKALDEQWKAEDAMIKALKEQGELHGDRIVELNDRIKELEAWAAESRSDGSY